MPIVVFAILLVRRHRSRTHEGADARELQPTVRTATTTIVVPRTPRRGRRVPGAASMSAAAVCLSLLALMTVPTTWATLNDQVTMAQVSLAAGSVNAPTNPAVADNGVNPRVSWTAPAAGLAPDSYDIFRTTTSGSYGGSPLDTPTASPYDDASAAQCTPYYYKVRSRRVNLLSAFTSEVGPLSVDHTKPVVASGHVYFDPAPKPKVADYVKVTGGTIEVFSSVSDNCSSDGSGITVTHTLGAPISNTSTATFGSYTPITGGPTFNYRSTYVLTSGKLANGVSATVTVNATDAAGNSISTAGTSVTGDGVGPTAASISGEMVSAYTNYYATALGYGEVPSDGTAKASGAYVYGTATDPSGIYSMTANLAVSGYVLKTGTTALALTNGSYSLDTTGSTQTWSWRSAATVLDTNLGDGTRYFTITATDALGNSATTSSNQAVEVDDTAIAATSSSCTHTGNNDNSFGSGDFTDFIFDDTVWPDAIEPGLHDTPISGTAVFINSAGSDYFNLNGDLGLSLFRGTRRTQALSMGSTAWVGANTDMSGTSLSTYDRKTIRVSWGAPAAAINATTTRTTTAYFSSTLRDAAGNSSGNFSEACTTAAW